MTIRLQIVMTVVFLLLFCIIYNMVRKRKLDLKLSLPWFIVLIGLIILVWIPDAIAKISDLMGVYSPVNMIFLCGFVFALILIFVLTTTVSRLAVRVRKLTQMVGILNKKLDSRLIFMDKNISEFKKTIHPDKIADYIFQLLENN